MAIDPEMLPAAQDSAHFVAGAKSGVGRLQKAAVAATADGKRDDYGPHGPLANLTPEQVTQLGTEVVTDWQRDRDGNARWRMQCKMALEAAAQISDIGDDGLPTPKNTPWPNASNVKYPLLITAVLQFAARAYASIVKNNEVAMVEAMGPDPSGQRAARAERQRKYLNHTIFYRVNGWEADTDAMLHILAAGGAHFRKVYVDPASRKQCIESVSALRLTKTHDARTLEESPRVTHDYDEFPNDVRRKQKMGVWAQVELPDDTDDRAKPRLILEQHLWRDFDDDGLDEPYIVTVDEVTGRVLRVDDAWQDADLERDETGQPMKIERWLPFAGYDMFPDIMGGSYGKGYGALISPMSAVIDTILNQSLDAGSMQAAGGGFIAAEVRFAGAGRNGRIRRQPGEYITVNSGGSDLKNAIVEADKPTVTATQFQLFSLILDAAQGVVSAGDVMSSDAAQNVAPTTMLAMIEQQTQIFNAIYKRIYRGMGDEQWLLAQCIARWGDAREYCEFLGLPDIAQQTLGRDMTDQECEEFFREDWKLDDMSVRPVGDPSSSTKMQVMAKGQLAAQFLPMATPDGKSMYDDPRAVVRYILTNAGIEEAEKWLPPPQPQQPDPLQQMMQQLQLRQAAATAAKTEAQARQADASAQKATAEAAETVSENTGPGAQLALHEREAQASIHLASAAEKLGATPAVTPSIQQ